MQAEDYLGAMEHRVELLEKSIMELEGKLAGEPGSLSGFERGALELVWTALGKAREAKARIEERRDREAVEMAAEELKEAFNAAKRILH